MRRFKNGTPSVQKVRREEIESRFVFDGPEGADHDSRLSKDDRVNRESGEFTFPVLPRMLRHARGYKLANDGQDTRAVHQYSSLRR